MKSISKRFLEGESDPAFRGVEEVRERLQAHHPEIVFERISDDPLDAHRNIVRYTPQGRQVIITHASPILQWAFAQGLLQHPPYLPRPLVAVCLRSWEEEIQDQGRQLRRQLRRMGYRVYLQKPEQRTLPMETQAAVILHPEDLLRNEVRVLHSQGQDQVSLEELELYLSLLLPPMVRGKNKKERRKQ